MKNIVCILGKVDNLKFFKKNLKILIALKQNNIIDDIIVVEWLNYPSIKYKLSEKELKNINLLTESEPRLYNNQFKYLFHQMTSLNAALKDLNDESFCLKIRPDLIINGSFIEELFTSKNFKVKCEKDNIFEYKVWVPYFEITKPYYIADECFWGQVKDLKKLVNFDVYFDCCLPFIGTGFTHIRRYIYPLLTINPDLMAYLKNAQYFGWVNGANRDEVLNLSIKNKFYLYHIYKYYEFVSNSFIVFNDGDKKLIQFRENYLSITKPLDFGSLKACFNNNHFTGSNENIYCSNTKWVRSSQNFPEFKQIKEIGNSLNSEQNFLLDSELEFIHNMKLITKNNIHFSRLSFLKFLVQKRIKKFLLQFK